MPDPGMDQGLGRMLAVTDPIDVWAGLLRYHAAVVEALEAELQAETGLPLTWYDVLLQLEHAPGGRLRMQDLASAVVLSKSGLTRLVDRMEQAGLVERETCPSDRRGTFATITAQGRTRFLAAAPSHIRSVNRHFSAYLTDAQLEVMQGAFEALLAGQGITEPGQGCAGADTSVASPAPSR